MKIEMKRNTFIWLGKEINNCVKRDRINNLDDYKKDRCCILQKFNKISE